MNTLALDFFIVTIVFPSLVALALLVVMVLDGRKK
jgi:hypothetical protein